MIVATNIAETSPTVDGIYYVVIGYCKLKVYNSRMGMTLPSSRSAWPTSARAARGARPQVLPLFTEYACAHELLVQAVPEIQRTNLGTVVLLKSSASTTCSL